MNKILSIEDERIRLVNKNALNVAIGYNGPPVKQEEILEYIATDQGYDNVNQLIDSLMSSDDAIGLCTICFRIADYVEPDVNNGTCHFCHCAKVKSVHVILGVI